MPAIRLLALLSATPLMYFQAVCQTRQPSLAYTVAASLFLRAFNNVNYGLVVLHCPSTDFPTERTCCGH